MVAPPIVLQSPARLSFQTRSDSHEICTAGGPFERGQQPGALWGTWGACCAAGVDSGGFSHAECRGACWHADTHESRLVPTRE
jgi:hypothetical protein